MSHLTIAFLSKEGRKQRQECEDVKLALSYVEDPKETGIICLALWSIQRTDPELLSMSDEALSEVIHEAEHVEKGLKIMRKKLAFEIDVISKRTFDLVIRFQLAITRGIEELYQVESARNAQKYELRRAIGWGLSQDSKHPWP